MSKWSISCAQRGFLPGYTRMYGGMGFGTLEEAARAWRDLPWEGDPCGGITREPNGTFTLRAGSQLHPSPSGEISWLITEVPQPPGIAAAGLLGLAIAGAALRALTPPRAVTPPSAYYEAPPEQTPAPHYEEPQEEVTPGPYDDEPLEEPEELPAPWPRAPHAAPPPALLPWAGRGGLALVNAWYGLDGVPASKLTRNVVIPRLRQALRRFGFIVVPAGANGFYGFDPFPRKVKTTAIHIRHNGQDKHLRAPEGRDFWYPPRVPPEVAAKALALLR